VRTAAAVRGELNALLGAEDRAGQVRPDPQRLLAGGARADCLDAAGQREHAPEDRGDPQPADHYQPDPRIPLGKRTEE